MEYCQEQKIVLKFAHKFLLFCACSYISIHKKTGLNSRSISLSFKKGEYRYSTDRILTS